MRNELEKRSPRTPMGVFQCRGDGEERAAGVATEKGGKSGDNGGPESKQSVSRRKQ